MSTARDNNTYSEYEKQGRSCCGCLCDMRRAVVILSALSILFNVSSLITDHFLLFEDAKDDLPDTAGGDKDKIDDLFTIRIIFLVVSCLTATCSVFGGILFNTRLVMVNAIWAVASLIVTSVLSFNLADDVKTFNFDFSRIVGPMIGTILLIFSHLSFIREVKAGIMTKENYKNEEQSCCCVSHSYREDENQEIETTDASQHV